MYVSPVRSERPLIVHTPPTTKTLQLGLWGRENGTFFENQTEFMDDSGFKHSTGALELIAMGTSRTCGCMNVPKSDRPTDLTN